MNLADKLKLFKEKINNATVLNQELGDIVGVELFDFIQENETFRNEFFRRVEYLDRLAVDKEFIAIQDQLYDWTEKILKLVSLEQIEKMQREWNNRFLLNLRNDIKKDSWTLPELYNALLKKENYYRLGDKTYFSVDGDIPYTPTTHAVKEQYKIIEAFFGLVANNIIAEDKRLLNKYRELVEGYNNAWYKFNEKIYTIPIKIHLRSFMDFFLFCTSAHPRKGYEDRYSFFHESLYRDGDQKIKKIKQYSNTVLDDLIELFRISDDGRDVSKNVELRSQRVIFDDKKAVIQVGERSVRLPPYRDEHYFCRAMFKHEAGKPVDWSIVYQEMSGKEEPEDTKKNKRHVLDTMYRVNRRVKRGMATEDNLFIWREKTIARNF